MLTLHPRHPIFLLLILIIFCLLFDFQTLRRSKAYHELQNALRTSNQTTLQGSKDEDTFRWADVKHKYPIPVESLMQLPKPLPRDGIPRIQHEFGGESREEKKERLERLDVIRRSFRNASMGYRVSAWRRDDGGLISGEENDLMGDWRMGLIGSLDTLWLMDLKEEFDIAIQSISKIDFSTSSLETINVFQATTRILGGLLGAYDISKSLYPELLEKAIEVGDMLYIAFDTPSHLPLTHLNFQDAKHGRKHADLRTSGRGGVPEMASLTLELTRLSQVTGNVKYFDAVQRVINSLEGRQDRTKVPGLWPSGNVQKSNFSEVMEFGVGGEGSVYEGLMKEYMLLGGGSQQYRRIYEYSMTAMRRNIFYRPMTEDNLDILFAGKVESDGKTPVKALVTKPQAKHLECFAGGMVTIGAKIFGNDADLEIGRQLAEGCLWASEVMPLGIMPEIIHTVPCENKRNCTWDEKKWHDAVNSSYKGVESVEEKIKMHGLVPGVAKVDDARHRLRPEAIESLFILYRITGDPKLRERAWTMFNTITKHTTTDVAHAALDDITIPMAPKVDRMKSFWMAETLKYFYLIFEDPSIVSLDDYVFNTAAHPLRRPG